MLISCAIFQIQRVESSCILLEGVITRQGELYSRSRELDMSQDIVDDATSPRGMHQGADKYEDDTIKSGTNAAEVANEAIRFAPSMGAIDRTFLYSMVWGLGGGLTGDPALAFDVFVRDLLQVNLLALVLALALITFQRQLQIDLNITPLLLPPYTTNLC